MATQLADAALIVNNVPIAYIPNTLKYSEGLGEQTTRAAALGGGQTEQIYSKNIESSFGKVMVEIPATVANIAYARQWKTQANTNVVQIVGSTPEGVVTRTFTQAAILNDYEVPLSADSNITIEFKTNPAV
jgi:hypothetical protein